VFLRFGVGSTLRLTPLRRQGCLPEDPESYEMPHGTGEGLRSAGLTGFCGAYKVRRIHLSRGASHGDPVQQPGTVPSGSHRKRLGTREHGGPRSPCPAMAGWLAADCWLAGWLVTSIGTGAESTTAQPTKSTTTQPLPPSASTTTSGQSSSQRDPSVRVPVVAA
jgi:hypothetical protein